MMEPDLKTKALLVIEHISAESDFERDATKLLDAMQQIYRVAHAGRNPICAHAHPGWEREVEEVYSVFCAPGSKL